jgi:hypothetical protein
VGVALCAALAWTRIAAPNSLSAEEDLNLPDPFMQSLDQLPLWIFQSIAAFPTRGEPAPPIVYVASLLALAVAAVVAGRGGGRVWLPWAGALLVVWAGVQLLVSASTYSQLGAVWQGRYALPFAVGIPVVLAALSDRAGRRSGGPLAAALLTVLLVLAHGVSIVDVYLDELRSSPLSGTERWLDVPAPGLVILVMVAAVAAIAALRGPRADHHEPAVARVPAPARVMS